LVRSRGMRRRPTKAEAVLADALKKHDIWFKQQAYFHTADALYIPDFRLAIKYKKLIVEVDGPSHKKSAWYDTKRTEWLAKNRNCVVLRFTNEQVLQDVEAVIKAILEYEPKRKSRMEIDTLLSMAWAQNSPPTAGR